MLNKRLLVIVILVVVAWFSPQVSSFQRQPVVTFSHSEQVLQHCADGQWRWFDQSARWSDGNLHLITEGVYYGGYGYR